MSVLLQHPALSRLLRPFWFGVLRGFLVVLDRKAAQPHLVRAGLPKSVSHSTTLPRLSRPPRTETPTRFAVDSMYIHHCPPCPALVELHSYFVLFSRAFLFNCSISS